MTSLAEIITLQIIILQQLLTVFLILLNSFSVTEVKKTILLIICADDWMVEIHVICERSTIFGVHTRIHVILGETVLGFLFPCHMREQSPSGTKFNGQI